MSKIKYRKVWKRVELSDYFEDSEGDCFEVWVNPHREKIKLWNELARENDDALKRLAELSKQKESDPGADIEKERESLSRAFSVIPDRTYEWYSEMIRFDGVEATPEELREISQGEDTELWNWIMNSVWSEIGRFRDRRKKV